MCSIRGYGAAAVAWAAGRSNKKKIIYARMTGNRHTYGELHGKSFPKSHFKRDDIYQKSTGECIAWKTVNFLRTKDDVLIWLFGRLWMKGFNMPLSTNI